MNFTAQPKAIVNVEVKRRVAKPTHGWDETMFKPKARIPTKLELIYDIYDAQRKIISEMHPKRYNCRVPTPVKNIERLYHVNPSLVTFDGLSYSQAMDKYVHQAVEVGIRNEFCIPFIFAKEIKVRAHAFMEGYSHIFVNENGLRYQILNTVHDFYYMTSSRQIVNNLSYHLNLEYDCNLHIAGDEAQRVLEHTGKEIEHRRHLFTEACDYYMNPSLLSYEIFLRAQVPEVRELDTKVIEGYVFNTDALLETDPELAYKIEKAKSIYTGKLKQWIGDFSHELPVG